MRIKMKTFNLGCLYADIKNPHEERALHPNDENHTLVMMRSSAK